MNQLIEFTNNNLMLVGSAVLMALAVVFYEVRMKASSVAAVSASQVVNLINRGATVVDIRDAAKYAQGHIVDSISIPASEMPAEQNKRLKKASSVIVVCDNGVQSGQCVASLVKDGMQNVFNLKGGISAWQGDNLPIVGAEQSATDKSSDKGGK
jgi:rhodanese-related sulfurtransferase